MTASYFGDTFTIDGDRGHRRQTPEVLPVEEPMAELFKIKHHRLSANFTHPLPNTTTFSDVTDVSFDILANQIMKFDMCLLLAGNEAADVKFQLLGPTGAEAHFVAMGLSSGAAADGGASRVVARSGLASPTGNFGLLSAATQPVIITGTVKAGSTPGTVKLQSGQGVAHATAHQVLIGSTLTYWPMD